MGAIGGMLGLAGGAGGTGFEKPVSTPILQPMNEADVRYALSAADTSLNAQEQLRNALTGANGIQNQSQVFGGLGNLSGQLGQIAAGQGPNPAQAMLNQQTGANVANQAALMAGQRGVGANAGLLARQAAQTGGALQQQAVGQGATMQAQQSLGALGQQAGVLGQMGNIAGTQVGNQMAQTQAAVAGRQNQFSNAANALAQQNQANVSMQSNINNANAQLAGTSMQGQQGLVGGLINAGGTALAAARGGQIPKYAPGGEVGPESSFGQFISKVNAPALTFDVAPTPTVGENKGAQQLQSALSRVGKKGSASTTPNSTAAMGASGEAMTGGLPGMQAPVVASKGGLVDVMVSPGEKIVPPGQVGKAAGGNVQASTVPGTPKVKGDSYANDVVHMKLTPGSIVVPRTKAKSNASSAEFVRKTLAKRGKK